MTPPPVLARLADAAAEATVVPSFSRLGFSARRWLWGWEDPAGRPMAGRVAVVTGASSGIGAALASELARLGATVHTVGRDPQRLEGVAERIRSTTDAEVMTRTADLADPAAVEDLAEHLAAANDRIDVLAHVAGALTAEEVTTASGLELTSQVHVLAPFVLNSRLLGPLSRSGDGRVITMTSGGMYTRRLNVAELLEPPAPFDGTAQYARAKRAQVEMNIEWARRHPDLGVGFHAVHPGWVDTPGLETALPAFRRLMGPLLRTPEQGADTAAWLAHSGEVSPPGGQLWHDRRPRHRAVPPLGDAPEEQRRLLWETMRRLAAGAT